MRKHYLSPFTSVLPVAAASHVLTGSASMNISPDGGKQTGARAPAKPF